MTEPQIQLHESLGKIGTQKKCRDRKPWQSTQCLEEGGVSEFECVSSRRGSELEGNLVGLSRCRTIDESWIVGMKCEVGDECTLHLTIEIYGGLESQVLGEFALHGRKKWKIAEAARKGESQSGVGRHLWQTNLRCRRSKNSAVIKYNGLVHQWTGRNRLLH